MTNPNDERFPKSARLVHQRDFDRVFASKMIASDEILVIHACRNNRDHTRLGLSISKRVGNSPVRNHWKRLIREAFRKQKYSLPQNLDLAIRPRKDAIADYEKIVESLARLCRRLARKCESK